MCPSCGDEVKHTKRRSTCPNCRDVDIDRDFLAGGFSIPSIFISEALGLGRQAHFKVRSVCNLVMSHCECIAQTGCAGDCESNAVNNIAICTTVIRGAIGECVS